MDALSFFRKGPPAVTVLTRDKSSSPRLAVVGGGLAGLAAAVRVAEHGYAVELFEARRRLGGRAGSFRDPHSGEWVDYCQHVAMGCCTNWLDFCRRTGLDDCFRRLPTLHFIAPDGRRCDFSSSRFLPPPLHLLPALGRLAYLHRRDRSRIALAIWRLARQAAPLPEADRPLLDWLQAAGQSTAAITGFWSLVVTSALGETLDRVSLAAARQVFRDGFLATRSAHQVYLPRYRLNEIYDRRLAEVLAQRGIRVHRGCRVRSIEGDARRARTLRFADGGGQPFDAVVAAVPWQKIRSLLCPALRAALPALDRVEQIEPAEITAVHLWYDRPITDLSHAALVGRLSQWVFRGPASPGGPDASPPEHGYQVVISASHKLVHASREELVRRVGAELEAIWPEARRAGLLRWQVVRRADALFAPRPGTDRLRPPQETPVANLALAGDWTATGWPATMEGAVRSGYLAAEALVGRGGRQGSLLAPERPRGWLARRLLG